MAVDYHVVDYGVGQSAAQVTADLNGVGVDGWRINSVDFLSQVKRRAIFTQAGVVMEYFVVDYEVGQPPEDVATDLDYYGADGWELALVDSVQHSKRRAIFMRATGSPDGGGGGGAFPDAPIDGRTYGRRNEAWDWVISHTNDVVDGGSF